MPQLDDHDCLSWGDALFLYLEREGMPLHIASLSVFEGDIPVDACRAHIEAKLPLIHRYRQRVVTPPFHVGLPLWEDDPNFDIRNHIREAKLRRGTESELRAATAAILSATMPRDRPLWDFTLLHGLKGGHTGVVARVHHCLADGIAGIGLMNVIMDASPVTHPLTAQKPRFQAPPGRDTVSLFVDGVIASWCSAVQRVLTLQLEVLKMAQQAARAALAEPVDGQVQAGQHTPAPSLAGLMRQIPELATPTRRLPFNVICQGPQQFSWAEIPMSEIHAVRKLCGATVNDIALAILTAAIRRYAELHRARVKGELLRIAVPVNVRSDNDSGELGNRISFLPVTIPLDIRDPRALVATVHDRMAALKVGGVAELVGLAASLLGLIPPAFQALAGPIASQLPLSVCNVICTNVRGPETPLYLLGHKMLRWYPYVPIGGEMGMNCAMLTYNGTAYFGFPGDTHAIPDLEQMPEFLMKSFAELQQAVGAKPRQRKPARRKAAPVGAVTEEHKVVPIPVSAQPLPSSKPAPVEEKQLGAAVGMS